MKENKEKTFVPDQVDNKDSEQEFDSRNQYSGSGDFSPDQEESQNSTDDLDCIIEHDFNNNPNDFDSDNDDQNQSDYRPKDEK